jgi:hypothetical protein
LSYRLSRPPNEYDRTFPLRIDGPADVAKFRTSPNKIHVVLRIGFCEGQGGDRSGCTFPGGLIFIAKSAANHPNRRTAALLLLHEIGHARGLDIPNSHNPNVRNFMFQNIRNNAGKLGYQCDALRGPAGPLIHAQGGDIQELSLEDFVGGVWPHGLPPEEVAKLTDAQVDEVRKWVAQDNYEFWPNAVTILGLRGSDADVDLVDKVLNTRSEDPYAQSARLNVPRALGYLAYRTNNSKAVDSLSRLMSPNYNNRTLRAAPDSDALVLAQEATQGMAIVAARGNETARRLLEEQVQRTGRGEENLGVGPDFFRETENLRQSVQKRGLTEGLRRRD